MIVGAVNTKLIISMANNNSDIIKSTQEIGGVESRVIQILLKTV